MSRKLFIVFLTTITVFITCCNQSFESSNTSSLALGQEPLLLQESNFKNIAEYVMWVSDTTHGFLKLQKIENTTYEFHYQPTLLKALERFNSGTLINNQLINSIINDSSNKRLAYFNIKVKENKGTSVANMFKTDKSIAEYFGYYAEKDFTLFCGSDTLSPVLYHYENTYPQFPYLSILLAFELPSNATYVQPLRLRFYGDSRSLIDAQYFPQQIFTQPKFDKINEIWQ